MRRRRRGCGCLPTLLALLLLGALGYGLNYALDALLYAPWAYGILGRSTLTGSWNGTLTTHSGVHYAVHLQLNRSHAALSSPHAPDIDGQVSWCATSISSTTSTVSGTSDRSASNVHLYVQQPARPYHGLRPSSFQGAWHGSTLVLDVLFERQNGHVYVFSRSIPDEYNAVPLTLHKGGFSAYQATCGHI